MSAQIRRVQIKAGIVIERYKPGYVMPITPGEDIIDALEEITKKYLGKSISGLPADVAEAMLDQLLQTLKSTAVTALPGYNGGKDPDDDYDRAMKGVI